MIYVFYFGDEGAPKTGLSPTLDIFVKVSDGTSAGTPPTPSELSGGFYKFTYTATEDISIRIDSNDATMADADRYIPLVASPHDDDLDRAVSTVYDRIGAPAGASIAADVDELESRLTAARAGYLDNLSAGAVALASVCTEARLAELDAANLPADVDAILADTGTTLETHLVDIKGTGFVKDTHSLPQCITATGFAVPGEYDTQMGYIPSDLGDVPTGSELDAAHGAGSWEGIPGSTDWLPTERKQIRDALGVDGDKTDVADSRIVDDIKKYYDTITGLLIIADSRIEDDIKKHDNKITGLLM